MDDLNVRGEVGPSRTGCVAARAVYEGDSPEPVCTVEWMVGGGSSTEALALVREHVERGERVPRWIIVDREGNARPEYD